MYQQFSEFQTEEHQRRRLTSLELYIKHQNKQNKINACITVKTMMKHRLFETLMTIQLFCKYE
jgi:hypothetical protein